MTETTGSSKLMHFALGKLRIIFSYVQGTLSVHGWSLGMAIPDSDFVS